MRRARRFAAGAAAAGLVAALAGCAPREERAAAAEVVDLRGTTMGTTWHVRYVGAGGLAEIRSARAVVEAVLDEIDQTFSTWNPVSEISRFNAADSLDPFAASEAFGGLVADALELARRTDGAYDPTLRPVLALFGFTGGSERRVPDPAALDGALAKVGHAAVRVEDGGRRIARDAHRELELSSIAKGYGVERVAAALAAAGFPAHFVEIGGEVQAAGAKPDGSPWRVGIERPPASIADADAPRAVQVAVPLRDAAIATSGSYRNFVESGSVSAHHVLDARTGRNPDHDVVAVSVLAPGCALADALATALLVVGPEPAADLLDSYRRDGSPIAALFLTVGADGAIVEQSFGWPVDQR